MSLRADGIVVSTRYVGFDTLLNDVSRSVPVVSLSKVDYEGVDSVHVDSYGAARLAVRHLVELGHREILHLAGPRNRSKAESRLRGYHDELHAHDLASLPVLHAREWDAVSGAACSFLAHVSCFTAVFAANDELALGFTSGMRQRGFTNPDDYSIVGVDDMPQAQFLDPPLTSVHLNFEELGEQALASILDRIRERPRAPHITTTGVLSIRGSSRTVGESSDGIS